MVVDQYMGARVKQENLLNLEKLRRVGEYRAKASLINVTLLNQNKVGAWQLPFGTDIELGIGVKVSGQLPMLELGIALKTLTGFEIASSLSSSVLPVMSFKTGEYYFRTHFCDLTLTPGIYRFGLGLRSDKGFEDHLPDAFELEILVSDATTVLNAHKVLGTIIPKVHFGVVQMNGVREKST